MSNIDKLHNMIKDELLSEHAAVLSYESGAVLEQSMYLVWAERHGLGAKDIAVIRGKMKAELMDVMAQAWTLCLKLGENPEEWLDMGCEKAVEAINKKLNGNLSGHIEGKW